MAQWDIIALSYTNCIKYGITPEDVVAYYDKVVNRLKLGFDVKIQALSGDVFKNISQHVLDHISTIDHSIADIIKITLTNQEIVLRIQTNIDITNGRYSIRPIISARDGLEMVFVLTL